MKHRIQAIHKLTDCKFLNLYNLETIRRDGTNGQYQFASRSKHKRNLKLKTKENKPDGVIIYSLYGEKRDKVVLIRQYRYPLDGYIYEFPAGLVEKNEDALTSGIREFKEETGLTLEPLCVPSCLSKPFFTTVGMTDESCATIYGYSSGTPTNQFQEGSEDIEIVIADKEEVHRILREENVAIMCAYMLMHFLEAEEGHAFDFLKTFSDKDDKQ